MKPRATPPPFGLRWAYDEVDHHGRPVPERLEWTPAMRAFVLALSAALIWLTTLI